MFDLLSGRSESWRSVRGGSGSGASCSRLCSIPGRSTHKTSRASPIRAVRDVLERQVADWNKGDLDAFLDGYWNSPKVVFQSGGNRFDGWEALRQRYRRRYQDEGRAMGQLEFSGLEIEPLARRQRWHVDVGG